MVDQRRFSELGAAIRPDYTCQLGTIALKARLSRYRAINITGNGRKSGRNHLNTRLVRIGGRQALPPAVGVR